MELARFARPSRPLAAGALPNFISSKELMKQLFLFFTTTPHKQVCVWHC